MNANIHRTANAAVRIGAAALLGAIIVANMAAADSTETAASVPWRDPARIIEAQKPEPVTADTITERLDRIPVPVQEAEPLTYWDEIPLDHDVQDYIVQLCEQREIDPAVVFAIIWRESNYGKYDLGDNGNAVGLMQIWEKYHADRMARLGCDNLSNPLQNVTVGIDYLDSLIDREKGLEWAVTAYNAGATGANRRGGTSEYARDVLAEAERMKRDVLT